VTAGGLIQIVLYIAALILLAKPMGNYMARVYLGGPNIFERVLGPLENFIYHISGIKKDEEMSWQSYAGAVLLFSLAGMVALYALQRMQGLLPLNPQGLSGISPDSSFNTAVSFTTNTNWQ
jgi:K+-transporting ATPase ATPase A chain